MSSVVHYFEFPVPPEFLTVPANISVSQGGSVKLPCSGTASPSPALSWWRMVGGNLTEVITDGQYFVTENFLLLPEVFERRDEGIYFCMLTSEAGNLTSDPIFLDILSESVSTETPCSVFCSTMGLALAD